MPKRTAKPWILFAYRVPREHPSRTAISRRLNRRFSHQRLGQGLIVLREDAREAERLNELAMDIQRIGGEASIWFASTTPNTHAELEKRFREARQAAEKAGLTAASRNRARKAQTFKLITEKARNAVNKPRRPKLRMFTRLEHQLADRHDGSAEAEEAATAVADLRRNLDETRYKRRAAGS